MPGFVKTARDEDLWRKAKAQASHQYPHIKKDSDRYWSIVNGIYQKMKGK